MSPIARIYATALWGVARHTQQGAEWVRFLSTLVLLSEQKATLRLLECRWLPLALRVQSLMDTCGSERVPTQAEPFLKRLLSRREMRWIGEIAVYFGRLWDKEQGILRFQIWEANGSQAMGSRFLKDRWAGRRVEFTVHENPNLLAGFVVKQGSAVWDYSVEGQLGALSEQFGILEEERLA